MWGIVSKQRKYFYGIKFNFNFFMIELVKGCIQLIHEGNSSPSLLMRNFSNEAANISCIYIELFHTHMLLIEFVASIRRTCYLFNQPVGIICKSN